MLSIGLECPGNDGVVETTTDCERAYVFSLLALLPYKHIPHGADSTSHTLVSYQQLPCNAVMSPGLRTQRKPKQFIPPCVRPWAFACEAESGLRRLFVSHISLFPKSVAPVVTRRGIKLTAEENKIKTCTQAGNKVQKRRKQSAGFPTQLQRRYQKIQLERKRRKRHEIIKTTW